MTIAPHRVALLALEDCYASSVAGFADVFHVANAHLRQQFGASARFYEWRFVSAGGAAVRASNGLPLACEGGLEAAPWDLVCVPGLYYRGREAFAARLAAWAAQRDWLRAQWEGGAVLAANCTGTFVLAETGLLAGRQATTTWWLEGQFRRGYPAVRLQPRAVVTDEDRLCCAGASASWLLQAVRMVERFSGAAIATRTARAMLIDVAQTTQLPYLPLQVEAGHDDVLVARAQHWLHQHLAEPVRLAALAAELAVSERTLIRRFKTATGTAPVAWLQTLRLDTARRLLEGSGARVEEVANRVGYQDASAFARLFREQVGMSPGAYRTRFRGGAAGQGGLAQAVDGEGEQGAAGS